MVPSCKEPLVKQFDVKSPEEVKDNPELENLMSKIQLMEDYGNLLLKVNIKQETTEKEVKEKDVKEKEVKVEVKADDAKVKGEAVVKLASELRTLAADFFKKAVQNKPTDEEKKQFIEGFVNKLHSQDKVMKEHRAAWKPIVVNILLALTGIGLIAIAIKAINARVNKKDGSLNEGLFFAKTKSQQKAGAVEEAAQKASESFATKKP